MRIHVDLEQIAATFEKFKGDPSVQESAQLFSRGLPVVEMLQAFSMNESVLRAFLGFRHVYPEGNLDRGILEKVILRVSQLHHCQFCIHSHMDMMRGLGIPTDVSHNGHHTARERVALEYAEQITRDANRVSDELFERVRAEFNESEIVELTFMIGLITMLNRFNNALRVRYQSEFDANDVKIH